MNECQGCKYEKSTDIKISLEFCTHCKRAYQAEEDRDMHEDKYVRMEKDIDITEQVFEALKTLISFVNENDGTEMDMDIEVPAGIIHTHFEFSVTKHDKNKQKKVEE